MEDERTWPKNTKAFHTYEYMFGQEIRSRFDLERKEVYHTIIANRGNRIYHNYFKYKERLFTILA